MGVTSVVYSMVVVITKLRSSMRLGDNPLAYVRYGANP